MLLKENVIENWATAIVNIAIEEKKIDLYIEQSTALIDALKNQDEFIRLLTIKQIHQEKEKIKILDDTFVKFGFEDFLLNVMRILVEQQAFSNCRTILKKTRKKLVTLHNMVYGVVWSTVELNEKQISEMEAKVSKKINKKVKLVNKIDSNLIGGVQIIVDNKLIDGSIKGKIDQIKHDTLKKHD